MTKFVNSLIILFSCISLYKCHYDYIDDFENPEDYYEDNNDFDDYSYYDNFNESLKNYLVDNGYFDSERLIEPYEMRKIVYEVISAGDPDRNNENMKKIFKELAEKFTEVYYNDKKQIRGKDIYDLINIDDIWTRFDDYLDLNSTDKFNFDEDDENDDLDDKDGLFDGDL